MNKHEPTTEVYVICPNRCINGMVKFFQNERALFHLVKCPYCKGKYKVTQLEAVRIESIL